MKVTEIVQLIISAGTLITMIILFYRTFRDPDIKAENDIGLLKQGCQLRHKELDNIVKETKDSIAGINKTFMLFQENDFKHIELRMTDLEKGQIEIKTILNERLPKK